MVGITEAGKTGTRGKLLAELLLSDIANVTPYRRDRGLDYWCELWDEPNAMFFVQAKGRSRPSYTRTTIGSRPIKCQTIEEYWLEKDHPVFVLMSDTYFNRTYYILVDRSTYKPTRADQKTYTFSIPLSNRITHDNIGDFFKVVMKHQPHVDSDKLEWSLQRHWHKHPQLYHGLDEINRLLEIIRGSDQEAQMEVRLLLDQRVEAGAPIPSELVQGLLAVLINCKDRITQNHALNALITLNRQATIPGLVPEILKQIDRNMLLYKYRGPREYTRLSPYTDFLFYALVRLKASGITKDLQHFLNVEDLAVNLNAIVTCGRLKLDETAADILRFIGHRDDAVRYQAAQALSGLTPQVRELEAILKISTRPWLLCFKPASIKQRMIGGLVSGFAQDR